MKSISLWLLAALTIAACGDQNKDRADAPGKPVFTREASAPEAAMLTALGNTKGNGGDVVVCFNTRSVQDMVNERLRKNKYDPQGSVNPFENPNVLSDISSIEMFDVYEFKLPVGFPPAERKLLPADRTDLQSIMNRIKPLSPGLNDALATALDQVPLGNWTAAPGIPELDDSDSSVFVPESCLLVQIAVRRDNIVYYDKHLYSKLDKLNSDALVLHELVYKIAVDNKHNNSRVTRQVVGMLLSENSMPQDSLLLHKTLKTLGNFWFVDNIDGSPAEIATIEIEADGSKKILLRKPQVTKIFGIPFFVDPTDKHPLTVSGDGKTYELFASLSENSALASTWSEVGQIKITSALQTTITAVRQSIKITHKGEDFFANSMELRGDTLVKFNGRFTRDGNAYNGVAEFYPQTERLANFRGTAQLRLKYFHVTSAQLVEFWEEGGIAHIENASVAHHSGRANWILQRGELSLDINTSLGLTQMLFHRNGEIAELRYPNSIVATFEWRNNSPQEYRNLNDLELVQFNDQGLLRKAVTRSAGVYSDYGKVTKHVGAATLNFCGDQSPYLCE